MSWIRNLLLSLNLTLIIKINHNGYNYSDNIFKKNIVFIFGKNMYIDKFIWYIYNVTYK